MAITFTSGLEPTQYFSNKFNSIKESEKRSAEFLQGTDGFTNPLETYITFPTGIASYSITNAGSGYLSSPTVTFVNRGSFSGSGATATTSITIPAGTVTGFNITAPGTGYTVAPQVVLTGGNTLFTFTDEDIAFDTNIITKTAHGMSDNDRIHLTTDNVPPLGLYSTDTYGNVTANPDFYVISATTDTFQLSKTSGGSAVDIKTRDAIGTSLTGTGVAEGESTSNLVVGIKITDAGARYTSVPTITISSPPSGGTQATATATLTDGRVTKVTMTAYGLGYVDTPTVTFSGGHGTHTARQGGGATVTATLGTGATAVPVTDASGVITSISVTAGGSNYTTGTTVSIIGSGGSGATATATLNSGAVNNVPVTNGGTSYASLTSLANRLLLIQTNLGNEINQANSDKIAINAWINGTAPSNWTNAGYNDTDLTNVYNTVHTYSLACVACKVDVDAIITSINTTSGTFKQHNERLCGLQAIGTSPFVPDFSVILNRVNDIEKKKHNYGVPFENYLVKLFGTLFTGDDTIGTATGNILTNPPWSGTPYDLAAYGVQSVISTGATAPSAIITVIGGFTTSVAAYEVLVTANNASFTAHKTNDESEYTSAGTFLEESADGRKHSPHWNDPYTKFMYTDVLGSETLKDIVADIDSGNIT